MLDNQIEEQRESDLELRISYVQMLCGLADDCDDMLTNIVDRIYGVEPSGEVVEINAKNTPSGSLCKMDTCLDELESRIRRVINTTSRLTGL